MVMDLRKWLKYGRFLPSLSSFLSPPSAVLSGCCASFASAPSSSSSSSNLPSIFTRKFACPLSPNSNVPSSPNPILPAPPSSITCHGCPSAVLLIHTRNTPSRREYRRCKLSLTSSRFRIMTASRRLSTSRSFLYRSTPSPTTTGASSSGISRSVGFFACRRARSARRVCSRCCCWICWGVSWGGPGAVGGGTRGPGPVAERLKVRFRSWKEILRLWEGVGCDIVGSVSGCAIECTWSKERRRALMSYTCVNV